jgi:hypothetical protein
MIFRKSILPVLLLYGFLYAQAPSAFFKEIPVYHALNTTYNNPATLKVEETSGAWYRYGFENGSGSLHHPLTAESFQYHSITAAGYKEMRNGTLFSGTFTYRQNFEFDRLFRQNTTLNGMIPVYMADSSAGDWHLNGIQWTVDVKKTLTDKVSAGLSVFYMVDEQYKQNFPKPGVKRNGFDITAGLFYSLSSLELSSSLSIFEFKEEMKTVKYSLEQNLNPVFMIFRGYDDPIYYRGQTSYERLQTRRGFSLSAGTSFNPLADSPFSLQTRAEWSRGEAADGGINDIPQGDWATHRLNGRFSWIIGENRRLFPKINFDGSYIANDATHPDFPVTLFQSKEERYNVFGGLSVRLSSEKILTAGLFIEGCQIWREDSFHGIGLEGKKVMGGPAFFLTMNLPVPFITDIYVKSLTEISTTSRIMTSPYRSHHPVNALTQDELWSMTTGDFVLESGALIRALKTKWVNMSLDVNYRWLADMNDDRSVNANRGFLYLTFTVFPHHNE